MGAVAQWQCFLTCPDVASAVPVADYLNLPDCPALAVPIAPSFDLEPNAAVLVPSEFLRRASHIWAAANVLGDLSDGELLYLTTGKLPGDLPDADKRDHAA
jgi:hypothetical protein